MEKDIPAEIISIANCLDKNSMKEVRNKLIHLLNELINKDFHALVQLLYRIDVNEKKIKHFLSEKNNEDAANVLADLIIERQLQKIESRKNFSYKKTDRPDEERW